MQPNVPHFYLFYCILFLLIIFNAYFLYFCFINDIFFLCFNYFYHFSMNIHKMHIASFHFMAVQHFWNSNICWIGNWDMGAFTCCASLIIHLHMILRSPNWNDISYSTCELIWKILRSFTACAAAITHDGCAPHGLSAQVICIDYVFVCGWERRVSVRTIEGHQCHSLLFSNSYRMHS